MLICCGDASDDDARLVTVTRQAALMQSNHQPSTHIAAGSARLCLGAGRVHSRLDDLQPLF